MKRYVRATFASLSNRNYRLFFIGQTISVTGTWMQKLAQAWLVLELTGSATWLGITLAIQQIPLLLLAPWGGLLADRFKSRTIMLWTATLGMVPSAVLGVICLTDQARMPLVIALALLGGCIDALDKPARQALPMQLVGDIHVANAVTLANVIGDSGKTIGPAVAGLCIAAVGVSYTFLLNAASFVGVIIGLLLMHSDDLHVFERATRKPRQVREGLRYVAATPALCGPLFLLTATGILVYNFQVMVPILAKTTFHGNAATAGYLLASLGGGSVLGGLAFAGLRRPSLRRVITTALILSGMLLLTAPAPDLTAGLVGLFFVGGSSVVFRTSTSTWLQLTAHPAMRGRVLALLIVAIGGTTPVGGPLVGWIASTFGARMILVVGGIGTAFAALIVRVYLRRSKIPAARPAGALPIGPRTAVDPELV